MGKLTARAVLNIHTDISIQNNMHTVYLTLVFTKSERIFVSATERATRFLWVYRI